jgi:chromosome segregation ATPase
MSERYWKQREGDEFFDDYIDVTDEVAALQAVNRKLCADVLRLETELGEERSLRMNTERDRDGYREGSRRLEAERDELRGELADARRSHEFTRQWYAERIERIRDLAKEHGIWPEAACILANGTAAASEPPTYAQILNGERHKHKRAAAERNRYRTALERIAGKDGHDTDPWSLLVAMNALKGGSDE